MYSKNRFFFYFSHFKSTAWLFMPQKNWLHWTSLLPHLFFKTVGGVVTAHVISISPDPSLDNFSTILIYMFVVAVLQNLDRSLPNNVLSCPQTNELQRLAQQLASSKVKHRPCERTLEPRVQRRIPKIQPVTEARLRAIMYIVP